MVQFCLCIPNTLSGPDVCYVRFFSMLYSLPFRKKKKGPNKKRKKEAILTCSRLKMMGAGGFPSPWQRISTVSPSLTKPSGDSFHISTLVVGSIWHTDIHKDQGAMNPNSFMSISPTQHKSHTYLFSQSWQSRDFHICVMTNTTQTRVYHYLWRIDAIWNIKNMKQENTGPFI